MLGKFIHRHRICHFLSSQLTVIGVPKTSYPSPTKSTLWTIFPRPRNLTCAGALMFIGSLENMRLKFFPHRIRQQSLIFIFSVILDPSHEQEQVVAEFFDEGFTGLLRRKENVSDRREICVKAVPFLVCSVIPHIG